MKQLIFPILITLFLMGCKKDELYGIYSNKASGFSTITLVVHESGHGCIIGSIGGGTFGQWSYNGRSSVLTLSYFSPGQNKELSYKFRFDQKKRTYTFTGNKARADPYSTLHFITNAIPDQLIKSFKDYPASLVINKQYAQEKENQRRHTEDKLEREKPEYERIRKSLEKNLKLALSDEFYVLDDTPATRALRSVLADYKIIFQEDSLVGLLTNIPPVKYWVVEMIFNRPELSAKTIEDFYPKALEGDTKRNYSLLANIANHPNTPICLVEDLATRTNFPYRVTGPANTRLINLSKAKSSKTPTNMLFRIATPAFKKVTLSP
jgi:hypothetical protein